MRIVADIETDNLLDHVTKIHCLCYYNIDTHESVSLTNYEDIKNLLLTDGLVIIGHYFVQYDAPVLRKILGIDVKVRLIDTLGLSWVLYPSRIKHGLLEWGEDLGVAKPPIDSWSGDTEEERAKIVHRCTQDVIINTKLFMLQLEYLKKIYNNDMAAVGRFMDYITFKLDCAREQEEVKVKIDVVKARENLAILEAEKKKKIDILTEIMPPSHTYKIKERPKVVYKKDGSLSEHGKNWLLLLEKHNLPAHHNMSLKLIDKTNKGNPNAHQQLKPWLFSLGWQPDVFKYIKDKPKEGEVYTVMNKETTRAVPQISTEDGTELSDSVKDLFDVEPRLVELDSLFKINHRIGCINAFLDMKDNNDFVKAEIAGFTNTLRFKHAKPVVNMPASPKKYWEMVRGCIVTPNDNHILCGADMTSLEDTTKQHYMYFFDPEYVRKLRTPGFDPHLSIGVIAGLMTEEQSEEHKLYEKTKALNEKYPTIPIQGKSHKDIRSIAKKTNFSAVYGAGAPKIALSAKIPLQQAKVLHSAYWKLNKAVKLVAAHAIHKTVDGQMWLYNPVSRFWYSLRYEKDKFSTLNQGTGVYCFDTWTKHVRKQGIKIAMQYHDEVMFPVIKEKPQVVKIALDRAIGWVNEEVKLNVPLGIDVKFGLNYASIH